MEAGKLEGGSQKLEFGRWKAQPDFRGNVFMIYNPSKSIGPTCYLMNQNTFF